MTNQRHQTQSLASLFVGLAEIETQIHELLSIAAYLDADKDDAEGSDCFESLKASQEAVARYLNAYTLQATRKTQ